MPRRISAADGTTRDDSNREGMCPRFRRREPSVRFEAAGGLEFDLRVENRKWEGSSSGARSRRLYWLRFPLHTGRRAISTKVIRSMPSISRRTQGLGTENAFVVLGEVNRLLAEGRDIANFCIGQPDFPTPKNVQDAAIEAIRGGKHGYTASPGIPQLREAAARYFSR